MTIEDYKQLDNLVLSETNVKKINRPIAQTELGILELVYDGTEYKFLIGDMDVTTEKLYNNIPSLLEQKNE